MCLERYVDDIVEWPKTNLSGLISLLLENTPGNAPIRDSNGDRIGSCYWSDPDNPAIAASTIAGSADYSMLPTYHTLYESDTTGQGKGWTPTEMERIRRYTAARGAAFHRALAERGVDLQAVIREELGDPPAGDEWSDIRETLARSNRAPNLYPPHLHESLSQEEELEDIVWAIECEVMKALHLWDSALEEIDFVTWGKEVPFLRSRSSPRYGGRMDRVIYVRDGERIQPGAYVMEVKLTSRLRPRDFVRAEAYRRGLRDEGLVARPLDAILVRIDIGVECAEVVTTRDAQWPGSAWEVYQRADRRFRDRYPFAEAQMRRTARMWG